MTESMVERVARAICVASGDRPDAIGDRPNDEGFARLDHAFPRWMTYRLQARAAIAAMREPTPSMLRAAGYRLSPDTVDRGAIKTWMDAHDWPRMIDCALSERPA